MNTILALLVVAAMGANGADASRERPARRDTNDRYSYSPQDTAGRYPNNQPATIRRDAPGADRVQGAAAEKDLALRDGIEAGIQAAGQTPDTDSLPPLRELDADSSLPPLPPWAPPLATPWPATASAADNSAPAGTAAASGGAIASPNATASPLADPSASAAAAKAAGGVSEGDSARQPNASSPSEGPPTQGRTAPPASDDRYRTDPITPPTVNEESDRVGGWGRPDQPREAPSNAGESLRSSPATDTAAAPEGTQATIRRSDDTTERRPSDIGLVPVQPQNQPGADTSRGETRWADSWSGPDPWGQGQPQSPIQPSQSSPPTAVGGASTPVSPWPSTPATSSQTLDSLDRSAATPTASQPPSHLAPGESPGAVFRPELPSRPVTPAPAPSQTASADQRPWMPLLLVGFGLAGSVGANLFLAVSYLDARRRYSSLAQKTADTFRQAREAA